MQSNTRRLATCIVALLALVSLSACSDSAADDAAPSTTGASETEPVTVPEGCADESTGPLRIVLVNDDGIINPAIDFMIERFSEIGDLDVTVVAPADERSGSSDQTTPGGASYHPATTPGGNPGYAVEGFPADAVGVALDDLALEPHLFVSGINPGQNFGPFAPLSGTVGVGRTAIRRGVPALAVSGGFEIDPAQFEFGADLAADWIEANCADLIAGALQTDTLASINIPACAPEQMGPLTEVPRALEVPTLPDGQSILEPTCDLADPAPANDMLAVYSGYPAITQVEADI
jgi:5'/3'-nucleotidase SurE